MTAAQPNNFPTIEQYNIYLTSKCNIQAKRIKELEQENSQINKELEALNACIKSNDRQNNMDTTEFGNFFNLFQMIISEMIKNNVFLIPKKNTENSKLFEQIEQSLFFKYVGVTGIEESEFIKYCKLFKLLKIGAQKNIVFTSSHEGKQIRTVFIDKSVIDAIRQLSGDDAE